MHLEAARRFVSSHRQPLAVGITLFTLAALAFRWGRHTAGFWGMDDAGITFSAAFELADHGSLAPYPEGTPVESYSNPLVFFVVVVLRVLGVFDPVTTHVRLEMILFAVMVTLVWSILRPWIGEIAAVGAALLFVLLQLLTPSTWLWYGSGLENVWVATGLVTLLWIVARTARGVPLRRGWGAVAFLVAITRPEAPVYVAAFYVTLAIVGRPTGLTAREHVRQVLHAVLITAVLYAVFLAWRRLAYHDWFPNTYYAKLPGELSPARNFREYVVAGILPYCRAGLFAASVLALLVTPIYERIATAILVFLVASLALPITAGADWMGEHRFATSFLAMAHLSYAALFGACVARFSKTPLRAWRLVDGVAIVAVIGVVGLLEYDRLAPLDPSSTNGITIGYVARIQGAGRWEQQMRVGVPNAVVLMPDAGGSLLVGGFQLVDSGSLTDFQMPRLSRNFSDPAAMRELDQYQHAERRPDLVNPNPNFPINLAVIGTRYFINQGPHFIRDDLYRVAHIDPRAKLLFANAAVRIFLSPETVRIAALGGLMRCELLVDWIDPSVAGTMYVRLAIKDVDWDEQVLQPFEPGHVGAERLGMLLGVPRRNGTYGVSIDVVRGDQILIRAPAFSVQVTTNDEVIGRAVEELRDGSSPLQLVRRIAWLREQQAPRMPMAQFQETVRRLERADAAHSARAGRFVMKLRWNARLAALGSVRRSIRVAEDAAIRGLFATCPAAMDEQESRALRTLCLGRAVYELRRYGYLGVLSRVSDVRAELSRARGEHDRFDAAPRYLALVGLALADPSDIAVQRQLLAQRKALARVDALVALD